MSGGYSKYSLNINMRQITVTDEMYASVKEKITKEDKSDFNEVYLDMLETQYKDYIENKDRPRALLKGRRRVRLAGLMGDRHGMLISSGCCLTEFKSVYTINYLEQLDLLFALAFNMTLDNARKGLDKVLQGKKTSREYLALILLTNICDIEKPTDITIGDLNKMEEVRDFLLVQIRNEIQNGQPVLSNLDGINYLNYLEVEDNPTNTLSIAVMIKLLKAVDKLNKKLVVQHYGRPGGGIVLSQDFSSISFASNNTFENLEIYHKGEKVILPLKEFRRS